MIDRKIVIGIIVFIGLGFTIFSFANPLDNKDNDTTNGDNGNNSGNTETIIPEDTDTDSKDTTKDNTKDDKKEETKPTTNANTNTGTTTNNKKPTTPTKKPTPTPPVEEEPTIPIYAVFSLTGLDKNLKISRNKNIITVSGTMVEKDPIPNEGINTGKYVTFKIASPRVLTKEEINNFTLTDVYGGIHGYGSLDHISQTEQSYFLLTQEFMEGKTIKMTIDWGDGKKVIYSIKFNITVTPKATP